MLNMKVFLYVCFLFELTLALPQTNQTKPEVTTEVTKEPNVPDKPEKPVRPEVKKDICLSKQCIGASHRLFQLMNNSVNPCDDFSEFACGNFYKEQIIPDDKGSYSSFTRLRDLVDQRARILIEEPIDEKKDFESHQKAKLFFKS